MIKSEKFSTGYFEFEIIPGVAEIFLSVTPELKYGPCIRRDGFTDPVMNHPEDVIKKKPEIRDNITHPNEQRACTWTIYRHLKNFNEKMGDEWQIAGAQGCGDLTMNPWHLAVIKDKLVDNEPQFPHLLLQCDKDFKEPYTDRDYFCLVKHKGGKTEFKVIRFAQNPNYLDDPVAYINGERIEQNSIELLFSGKPIIQSDIILPLYTVIDKFQDIRHIFGIPKITFKKPMVFKGKSVKSIYFGEHYLFDSDPVTALNRRRQALTSSLMIPTSEIPSLPTIDKQGKLFNDIKKQWLEDGNMGVDRPPREPGEYRFVKRGNQVTHIDIYFRRNVYPFSATGIKRRKDKCILVCLASHGKQFMIGDTIETMAEKMYHYGGCSDAMIMDEGFDVFQMVNMKAEGKSFESPYSNTEVLEIVAQGIKDLIDKDYEEQKKAGSANKSIKEIECNKDFIKEINKNLSSSGKKDDELRVKYRELFTVEPHRPQLRAILILALKPNRLEG